MDFLRDSVRRADARGATSQSPNTTIRQSGTGATLLTYMSAARVLSQTFTCWNQPFPARPAAQCNPPLMLMRRRRLQRRSDAALRSAAPSPAPTACRSGFNTRVLDNGASLEEVQRAAGHADATTTKLCDRRGYNPEQSASFFASY